MLNYNLLPVGLRSGMRQYIENGIRPGYFLYCVLENNFIGAFNWANSENRERMGEIVSFLCNEAPVACFGSRQQVEAYIKWKTSGAKQGD